MSEYQYTIENEAAVLVVAGGLTRLLRLEAGDRRLRELEPDRMLGGAEIVADRRGGQQLLPRRNELPPDLGVRVAMGLVSPGHRLLVGHHEVLRALDIDRLSAHSRLFPSF